MQQNKNNKIICKNKLDIHACHDLLTMYDILFLL